MLHLTAALDPVFPGAFVPAALPQPGRGDPLGGSARRDSDAGQAQPGRGAGRVGEHGGRGLSDAGSRRVSGQPGPQRLLCAGISRPAGPSRAAGSPGACRLRPPVRRCSTTCPPAEWIPGCSRSAPGRGSRRNCFYTSPQLLARGDPRGDIQLRQALAGLSGGVPRGALYPPARSWWGAGIEYLLSLLAPLLPGPAAGGGPGLPPGQAGAGKQRPALPADPGGRKGDCRWPALAALGCGGVLCHPPATSVPTGVTMPAPRRAELLGLGAPPPPGRYLSSRTTMIPSSVSIPGLCPSLQGMAGGDGPVIYLSTVARSLAPGIRLSPIWCCRAACCPAWQERYSLYSATVGRFEQQTLARIVQEGYFNPPIWPAAV